MTHHPIEDEKKLYSFEDFIREAKAEADEYYDCFARIYTYRTEQRGDEYVGLCLEFPSLSFLHKEKSEAIRGIERVVMEAVKIFNEPDESLPKAPLANRNEWHKEPHTYSEWMNSLRRWASW